MKNKKILFIHHGQEIGGAPRSLKNTIIGLEKEGFQNLKILCVFPDMKPFFQEGTNVQTGDIYSPHLLIGRVMIGLSHWSNIRTFFGICKELCKVPLIISRQIKTLKQEKPDIIHLNSSILFLVAFSAKILKIPLVWHVREVIIGGQWNLRKKLSGWLIRKLADQVVCISEVEADALGDDRCRNVHVVYNFIDFSTFGADEDAMRQLRETYNLGTKKVAVSLGGVSFRKGTFEIIETAKQLPDMMFLIAGTLPQHNNYSNTQRTFIKFFHKIENSLKIMKMKKIYSWYYQARIDFLLSELRLPNLLFIGKLDNVAPLIAISDCLIFAGCTPHFPRPVYEAWAMKKAVITFDMKGISENIVHAHNAIITKTNNSLALAESIIALLSDDISRDTMGKAGYKQAQLKFDMTNNVKKIIHIYDTILFQTVD